MKSKNLIRKRIAQTSVKAFKRHKVARAKFLNIFPAAVLFVFAIGAMFCPSLGAHITGGILGTGAVHLANTFAKISPEDEAKLAEGVRMAAQKAMDEKMPGMIEKALGDYELMKEFKEIVANLKDAKTLEEVKTQRANLDELALKFKAFTEKADDKARKQMSFADSIMDSIKKNFESISKLKSQKGDFVNMTFKTPSTMTESGSVIPIGTNSIPFSLSQFLPGYTPVVRRNPFIVAFCNVVRTTAEYIAWAEQTSTDPGAAANTAENSAKTQGSFTWTEKNTRIEKITYYSKLSKEILNDLSIIEAAVRAEIMEVIQLRLDQQIFQGNGTSPQIKGLTGYAQAFVAPSSMANSVDYASNYDVLHAAITQIRTNGTNVGGEVQGIFNPSNIFMNPIDIARMISTKDTLGRYVVPPFVSQDGMNILGIPITENVGVPSGYFMVGDMSKAMVAMREDATIAIGYENDDFTKNLVTILGEMRAGLAVKSNHVKAFVYDSFANALPQLRDSHS